MSQETVLARKFDLEINTGTDGSPVWTPILGITGISPAQSAQRTDDTTFDTDGWERHTVAMRGRSLSVSMLYEEDPTDGTTDDGQQALIDLGDASGVESKVGFRYKSPQGNGHTFKASADVSWPGGDKVANANFTAELTLDGPPVPIP